MQQANPERCPGVPPTQQAGLGSECARHTAAWGSADGTNANREASLATLDNASSLVELSGAGTPSTKDRVRQGIGGESFQRNGKGSSCHRESAHGTPPHNERSSRDCSILSRGMCQQDRQNTPTCAAVTLASAKRTQQYPARYVRVWACLWLPTAVPTPNNQKSLLADLRSNKKW